MGVCSCCLKALLYDKCVFIHVWVYISLVQFNASIFFFTKLLEEDLKANGVKEEGGDVTVIEGLCIIIDICRTFLSSYVHYLVNYSLFST